MRWLLAILFACTATGAMAQAVGNWGDNGPILFPVNVSGQVDGMGRVCQIKFHPTNAQKMYAVSASGGLYISINNGQSWSVTGTDQLPTTQCSSVCIDFTNDNTLYLSTGDPNYYYEDYGIYKSIDGGATWTPSNTSIGNRMAVEIIMDPTNHNTLVAATDDGMWKSTDAGATWSEKINGGQFKSMMMKPGSSTIMYAVTDANFYKSTNMGTTWTQITNGFVVPAGNGGLRIAVSAASPNIVYVGTTDGYGEILKSTDEGLSFTNVYTSNTQCIVCYDETIGSGSQGNYNFGLTANPNNANELLLISHCVWRSTDGGVTWSKRTAWYAEMHTDMHDIKWNPYNNTQRWDANDGGVWMSTDTVATYWLPKSDGLAATEIYHAAQSPIIRQMISIGTQDNGELYYDNIWKCNRGGDWGAKCDFDYLAANVWYLQDGQRRLLQPLGGDQSWNSPYIPTNNSAIAFLPSMHNVAFVGHDTLWRSTDIDIASPSWTRLNILNGTIQDIASCHADSNILYAVTNTNRLYRSDNALAANPTFTLITTPASTNVSTSLATDKHNANIVYITCGSHIYRSANKGVTWTAITGNLPNYNILRVISDDYSLTERLFVCLGNYVYYTDNNTNVWTNTLGMPTIPQITDFMTYNDGTSSSVLRLSTYGRGVWECNIHNDLPPTAGFTSNKQYICPGDTVRFSKYIYGNYTSFNWAFPGGNPATSTLDSPTVIYTTPGTYDVTLNVISPSGNTIVTQTAYIVVSNGQASTLQEGFEGATFPPTSAWVTLSQSGNNWQQTNAAGGFGLSAHSMLFDNFDNDAGGRHDKIITPTIDLTNSDSAYVTFDVAYAYYPDYHDSLMVEVSTDCGKTFVPVYEKDSVILATTANQTSSFVPLANEWRKDTISLNAYVGNPLELAFDNIGHYGNNVYIDNINLVSHTIPPNSVPVVSISPNMNVYPNPTTGVFTLHATAINGAQATVVCHNALGQVVVKRQVVVNNKTVDTKIDISRFAPGAYTVSLEMTDNIYIRQIILK